jgi:transposase InsO family protein
MVFGQAPYGATFPSQTDRATRALCRWGDSRGEAAPRGQAAILSAAESDHQILSRVELANAIHDYIELFHNTRRRHSALGMLTPTEYEDLHNATQGA